jgi:hypothetical protein
MSRTLANMKLAFRIIYIADGNPASLLLHSFHDLLDGIRIHDSVI